MYCKFINKNYVYPCPASGYVEGRAISNLPRYYANNPEMAKAEGYKLLVVDEKPDCDVDCQYLTHKYEDTEDAVIQRWIINDTPLVEETPKESVEERLDKAEEKLVEFDKKFKATEIMLFGEAETDGE